MEFRQGHRGIQTELADLFRRSFAASEGASEGDLIHGLFQTMVDTTPGSDLNIFSAWESDVSLGCIAFTRMRYAGDPRHVVLLSPVAVAPDHQRKGIGQALINHGLSQMREAGVDVAVTYGDPKYYAKTGFKPVTEEEVPPPQQLSMPHGWQAQALDGKSIGSFSSEPVCAPVWGNQSYW